MKVNKSYIFLKNLTMNLIIDQETYSISIVSCFTRDTPTYKDFEWNHAIEA